MWSGLHAADELGGLRSAAVPACGEVWDAVSRWSMWVILARAGKGLGQTGGGQRSHSTGEVMESWEGNDGCCPSGHSATGG